MTTACTDGTHDRHDVYSADCACRSLLDLLANRWSALAIGVLEEGPTRFGDIKRRLDGITPKVLTKTLRGLEDAGFLTRTVLPEVPLHVEYELTELGRSAAMPLSAVRQWAEDNLDLTSPAKA